MLIKYMGKNKFIFIANTKCASTSIEASKIGQIADIKLIHSDVGKHISLEKTYNRFDYIFNKFDIKNFFKFGIIRNPVDWVVSWFNYRSRSELKDPNHPLHKNYTGNMTFNEFWNLNQNKGFLKPQSLILFSPQKNIKVDFIIQQEKLLEDLATIQKVLKIESLVLQKKNKSETKRIRSQDLDDAIKKEIGEKYHQDYNVINNLEDFNSQGLKRFLN